MQVKGRRLEGKADAGVRNEIEQQLVRGTRAHGRDRSRKTGLDVAVVVAADHPFDVTVIDLALHLAAVGVIALLAVALRRPLPGAS